ncbi:hypothetical protein, partial [Cesiribacter andamanensis]|uniref:hypothetical protein n=1 Tax=Cesiribacter andamanensis TaxID=649507 RepID=UPI00058D24D7
MNLITNRNIDTNKESSPEILFDVPENMIQGLKSEWSQGSTLDGSQLAGQEASGSEVNDNYSVSIGKLPNQVLLEVSGNNPVGNSAEGPIESDSIGQNEFDADAPRIRTLEQLLNQSAIE